MSIPLEDNVSDIIGKAQRGLGIDDAKLAAKIGVEPAELDAIKAVQGASPEKVEKLARALRLGPRALTALAAGTYQPTATAPNPGFFQSNTAYGDMKVNAYLIWDAQTALAAVFDTGGDCSPLVEEIESRGLTLQDIYLTHAHADHVAELDRLCEKLGGSIGIHVNQAEAKIEGAVPFQAGVSFSLGRISIESRDTSGHSPGGTTYHIHGLDRPLAIVGDALFAGSVGGIHGDYQAALRLIRENILSAQDGTVIAPGHGPLTTVIQEKMNNPFFPDFRQAVGQGI